MTASLPALTAALGVAGMAGAQNPSFSYSLAAPAVLAPGATATITVLCGFTPGVGQMVATSLGPFPVLGLESGGFSIAASGGQWGAIMVLPPFWANWPGMVIGSNVNGAAWGIPFVPPSVPSTVNPTPVWRGTFTMPASNVTLMLTGNGNHFLWAQHPQLGVTTNGVPASGTRALILVPAPGVAAPVALGLLLFVGRRPAGVGPGGSEA